MYRGLSQFVWCIIMPFIALTFGVLTCSTISWMSSDAAAAVLFHAIIVGIVGGRLIFRLMRRKFKSMTLCKRMVCLLIEIPLMAAVCVGAWMLMENIFSQT